MQLVKLNRFRQVTVEAYIVGCATESCGAKSRNGDDEYCDPQPPYR